MYIHFFLNYKQYIYIWKKVTIMEIISSLHIKLEGAIRDSLWPSWWITALRHRMMKQLAPGHCIKTQQCWTRNQSKKIQFMTLSTVHSVQITYECLLCAKYCRKNEYTLVSAINKIIVYMGRQTNSSYKIKHK